MSKATKPPQRKHSLEAYDFATEVAEVLASKNPGLFVTSDLCEARTKGIEGQIRVVVRLLVLVLTGLMVGFVGVIIRG